MATTTHLTQEFLGNIQKERNFLLSVDSINLEIEKLDLAKVILQKLISDPLLSSTLDLQVILHCSIFQGYPNNPPSELQDVLEYIYWIFNSQTEFCFDFKFHEYSLKVQQQPSFIASHGGKVWGSGIVLSRYLIVNQSLFKNKNILELGTGTGIASLTASFFSELVTSTDWIPEILENIKQNALWNKRKNLKTSLLNWSSESNDSFYPKSKILYDYILGADIVYSKYTAKIASECISKLFFANSSAIFLGISGKTREGWEPFKNYFLEKNIFEVLVSDIDSSLWIDLEGGKEYQYQMITVTMKK